MVAGFHGLVRVFGSAEKKHVDQGNVFGKILIPVQPLALTPLHLPRERRVCFLQLRVFAGMGWAQHQRDDFVIPKGVFGGVS